MRDDLFGIGLYTPVEAERLLKVPSRKISRWLRGHQIKGKGNYEPLWTPEVDLEDGKVFLGFRDLMEVRVASAFIECGLSARRVRTAIDEARRIIGQDHPLATNRFRTDGREIFLHVIETGEDGEQRERLLNLFKKQYEFKGFIEPILKTVDLGEDGTPSAWWPAGRRFLIVIDPARAFGAPIDSASSVPTSVLANAAREMGLREAARAYEVSESSVRNALEFETSMEYRQAA
ncbi:hypothetical protein FIV00_02915 [Labrenzia sp. THAF82]|uniref:hypothetical protein n=1 Tax=Labrenzia sp. THAF82 TaxID=2587861 RepID=UPI0012696EF6|nr:hypothetical protein [Labrenzia sp. THAF82]QFT29426.1 hypothetical protein FIV00_02915 [Labrenzia sp. THAF82]